MVQAIDLHLDPPPTLTSTIPFPPRLAKERGTPSILEYDRFVGPDADLKLDPDNDGWDVVFEG